MTELDAATWLEEARVWAEGELGAFLDSTDLGPPALEEAIRYALLGGGKRIRPALVRLVGDAHDADPRAVAAGSVAVECIHTYSLVHDDLPCMDDDDLRRGRPTVHRKYDDATAVLVGDALQSLAFEALAVSGGDRAATMAGALARAAGPAGMVGGQVLDLAGEGRDLDADAVRGIHAAKTAALLGASAELGALAAERIVGGADSDLARSFGVALGLCFQAMDDVLDVTGDAGTLGKTPGKDAGAAKGTLVATLGLEGARDEASALAREAKDLAARLGLGALGNGLVELLLRRNS
ncbi:MAG: polyprenyl synthetase family protein [Planctomycetota bacterium]